MKPISFRIGLKKKKAINSIGIFMLNFFIYIAVAVVMLIMSNPNGYMDYAKTHKIYLIFFTVCVLLLFAIVYLYYFFEDNEFLSNYKNVALIFTLMLTSLFISFFMGNYINIYARPVALFALLALLLLGRRSAIFLSIVYALMMFTFDSFLLFTSDNIENVYSTLMICFFAGMLAIFVVSEQISRFKVFLRSIIIYLPIALIILLMEISEYTDVLLMLSYGLLGALSSVVIFIAILPLFENIFNVVTDYRLRELCDHDYKLIKDLKEKASGTFNHSIIVAYLAEACAIAINEDTALARAAAYYHDVGKLKQPEFFAENQTGYNPHDELAPELSVDIIRSHARDGYELIKAHRLPAQLADVALQHHGTMPITFFYAKALKLTDGEVKREDFSYYGPKPQSKIAAIIMICDASEAVTRTLLNRLPENVEQAVREVIEERMNFEQFSDCEITMKDLSVIKDTIVTYLTGVNHSRVKYPKLKIKAKTEAEIKEEEGKNV